MPFIEAPRDTNMCILLFLSLYTYQLLDLLIYGLDRLDFNEMLVHHICAVSLTFGTIFANSRGIGIIVAFLHGVSDIPVNISRIFASLKYVPSFLIIINAVAMLAVWIWLRIFVFGYLIYRVWGRRFSTAELS